MVLSVWRGFVREIISLIGIVLAFFVAGRVSGDAGSFLNEWIENGSIANIAGFILVFVLVMVTVGIIGALVRKLVTMADLSTTDRTLGVFFGAARGVLLIGVAFLIYTAYAKPDQSWMQKSALTPYAIQLSDIIGQTIPKGYPFSTQSPPPQLPSAKSIVEKTTNAIKDSITPEDQDEIKSLFVDALKDNKP